MKPNVYITQRLERRGEVTTAEVVRATGLSRTYIHRILQGMENEGRLRKVGKANRARYVLADSPRLSEALAGELLYNRFLKNRNLQEDIILKDIKRQTAILRGLSDNVGRIVDYGFTEILNNAIEHSRSETVSVHMERTGRAVGFSVVDRGIGIFRNIKESHRLESEVEGLRFLLKGKQTTDPKHHSGEGLFFSSRVASFLQIKSSNYRLTFDNRLSDVLVAEIKGVKGTRVEFWVDLSSTVDLAEVFNRYAGQAFTFDRTEVRVALYRLDSAYLSRSQARRILAGLEKFNHVVLDFHHVTSIGQAFADEVFRVWKNDHPKVAIETVRVPDHVMAMIRHAGGE
jgi:plasmid maintenance system antidote protein VapI